MSEPDEHGWFSIETAPKDGTLIILANAGGSWVGYFRDRFQSGYRPQNPWQSMLLNHEHMLDGYTLKPTHWQPLPKPPVQP